MSWTQFRYKYGLHDGTDPAQYAYAVFQAANSFIKVMTEKVGCECDYACARAQVTSKLAHLEELREELRCQ